MWLSISHALLVALVAKRQRNKLETDAVLFDFADGMYL